MGAAGRAGADAGLFLDRYADFTVKHFHEQLQKPQQLCAGLYGDEARLACGGLVAKGAEALSPPQEASPPVASGILLYQDGWRHVWPEGLPAMDLIVTMDDGTSDVYSMFLVEKEGTASTFRALGEMIGEHGRLCALYTDRGSHCF